MKYKQSFRNQLRKQQIGSYIHVTKKNKIKNASLKGEFNLKSPKREKEVRKRKRSKREERGVKGRKPSIKWGGKRTCETSLIQ